MACGNNMVSRSSLQSAPASIAMPAGPGPMRPQPTAEQVAAVQQQTRAAIDQAERRAASAATPAAASEAVKEAQRALDAARRMRGPASERASIVRELERKLDRVKDLAAAAATSFEQADRSRRENQFAAHMHAEDRLRATALGVPPHRSVPASAPEAPPDVPELPQPSNGTAAPGQSPLLESLPLSVAPDLTVERVEQLSLDHPLAPADLTPNTAYVYGDNVYVTDENGDAAYMHGIATYVPNAPRHDPIQLKVGRDGNDVAGDRFGKLVGGHIGGVSLGGYPSGPNLFAQNKRMNVSSFAIFENQFRELAQKGERVEYEVRLAVDAPGEKVPSVAILQYWINDVHQGEYPLLNEPHQLS
jgi:DNA/RNA non-specific endonuclease